jgi:hypothetical protein
MVLALNQARGHPDQIGRSSGSEAYGLSAAFYGERTVENGCI